MGMYKRGAIYGKSPLEAKFTEAIRAMRAEDKAKADALVEERQKACPHPRVAHWTGSDGDSSLLQSPRRICTECGYEEEGGWWCYSPDCQFWHASTNDAKALGGVVVTEEQAKLLGPCSARWRASSCRPTGTNSESTG